MTMKPFEIQSTSLSIGGVTIDTSAQGKLVIPGVTRAGTSVAIEVQDTGDQTVTWNDVPVVIDGYTFASLNGDLVGQQGWTAAVYAVDQLDENGYIDGISIVNGGAGYTGEAVTYSEVMYAAPTGTQTYPFNNSDWTEIPFSVRCGAGEIVSEFGNVIGTANRVEFDSAGSIYQNERDNNRFDIALTAESNVSITTNEGEFTFNFRNDGVLELPPNGDIVDSNGTSVLGGSGSTGDISFNGTEMYADSNIDIYTNSQTYAEVWLRDNNEVLITADGGQNNWKFNAGGGLRFPDGTTQTTAYTGQTFLGSLYICANRDGNIVSSTDGITWSDKFNTGIVNIGKLAIGDNKIIFTRSDNEESHNSPGGVNTTGLYITDTWNVQPSLISGTDFNNGDLFWNEIKYFENAPFKWVAVGYSNGDSFYPVYAYSNNGTNFTIGRIVNGNNAYGDNAWFNDVAYNGNQGYFFVGAIHNRDTTGLAYYSTDITQNLDAQTQYVDTKMPLSSIEFLQNSNVWGSSWVGFDYNGHRLAMPYGSSPDPTQINWQTTQWDETNPWKNEIGYVPGWADSTSGDYAGSTWFVASTNDGQIMYWPNLPEGPYISIPKPYTTTNFTISKSTTSALLTTDIVPKHNEKLIITNANQYNATVYIHQDGYGLYTDQTLTTPWDTSGFADFTSGTLTFSHGEFIDAVGYGNGVFFCANDSEELFRSTNGGYTWTQVDSSTGDYMNDISYGTISGSANSNLGNFVFDGNEMYTVNEYPTLRNATGSYGGVEIDYVNNDGVQKHAMWLNGVDGLQIQVNSDQGPGSTNWNFFPDGTLSFPDGTKQTTAHIGSPKLARSYSASNSGDTTVTIDNVTIDPGTIVILASGTETINNSTKSKITSISGTGNFQLLTWTKYVDYTDPTTAHSQTGEIWYATLTSAYLPVTGNLTITYDNEFDDQSVILATFQNVNLESPFEGTPIVSSKHDDNACAVLDFSTTRSDTLGIAFFGASWEANFGYPIGWGSISNNNDNGEYYEFISLYYKVFDAPGKETIRTAQLFSDRDVTSIGIVLAGLNASANIMSDSNLNTTLPGTLTFGDGTVQETAYNKTQSWVAIVGDGANFHPHYDVDGWEDLWFDAVCAGPDDTVFAAGGWGRGYNPIIYQYDKDGKILWRWMDNENSIYSSVSSIAYNNNKLYATVPGANVNKNYDGTRVYTFNRIINPQQALDGFSLDNVRTVYSDNDQGSLKGYKVIAGKYDWTLFGEKQGNHTVAGSNIIAAQGTTAERLYINKTDINYEGKYPEPNDNWFIVATNGSGLQLNNDYLGNKVGHFFINTGDYTTTGNGNSTFDIYVRYNQTGYEQIGYTGGTGWVNGDTVTIKGDKIGGKPSILENIPLQGSTSTNSNTGIFNISHSSYPRLGIMVDTSTTVTFDGNTHNVIGVTHDDTYWYVEVDTLAIPGNGAVTFNNGVNNDLTFTVHTWGESDWIYYYDNVLGTAYTNQISFDYTGWGGNFTDPTYRFQITVDTSSDPFVYSNNDEFAMIQSGLNSGRYRDAIFDEYSNSYYAVGSAWINQGDSGLITKISRNGTIEWTLSGAGEGYNIATDNAGHIFIQSSWDYKLYCIDINTKQKVWETALDGDYLYYESNSGFVKYVDGYLYAGGQVGGFLNNYAALIEKIDPTTGLAIWSRVVESNNNNWYSYYNFPGDTLAVTSTGVYFVGYGYFPGDDYENACIVKLPLDGGVEYEYMDQSPTDIRGEFKISGRYQGTSLTEYRQVRTNIEITERTDLERATSDFATDTINHNSQYPGFNYSFNNLTSGLLQEHDPTFVPEKNAGFSNDNTYTLQLSDAGKFIRTTWDHNGSNTYINVPSDGEVDFPVGTVITLINMNNWNDTSIYMYVQTYNSDAFGNHARVYHADINSPLNSNGGWSNQWGIKGIGTATLMKIGANEWLLSGNCYDTDY